MQCVCGLFEWVPMRLEQKSIQSEVRIRNGGAHRLLRKKVYNVISQGSRFKVSLFVT